jgi:hypothetical protein
MLSDMMQLSEERLDVPQYSLLIKLKVLIGRGNPTGHLYDLGFP